MKRKREAEEGEVEEREVVELGVAVQHPGKAGSLFWNGDDGIGRPPQGVEDAH
jgi:hypothetical protein